MNRNNDVKAIVTLTSIGLVFNAGLFFWTLKYNSDPHLKVSPYPLFVSLRALALKLFRSEFEPQLCHVLCNFPLAV